MKVKPNGNSPFSRRFTAPPNEQRCQGAVIYKDGSGAQCMHRKQPGRDYCRQHGPKVPMCPCGRPATHCIRYAAHAKAAKEGGAT